jgi:hypothetical protein|tara:strand:- start:924 stop:1082 length:159 start_codon:yes stop_codon:yes gene_type:complete
MSKNKKEIFNKIIQTKSGSAALTCFVGSAILVLSMGTVVYSLYSQFTEQEKA